jgi:cbb3-type cytochrome oxidase subunit 3
MKLSDVMGAADLAIFAEAALVLFFGVFLLVLVRAAWPGHSETWSKLGRMPLDDDQRSASGSEGGAP